MKFEVGSMKSEVGANNAGEFMRRYSPLMRRGKSPTIDRRRRGESCRRIHAPLIAVVVGANHAGEFMRRYSPGGGANHVGEFMRRYSPLMRRGKSPTIDRRRRGESCRRIYAPLFALDNDNPIQTLRY